MSRVFLGGFVVIAAIAVGAVDYVNQARRAGSTPGAFGVSDYLGTMSGRFGDQQAALAAERTRNELLAMPTKTFLPEPPEGWTREDWSEATAAEFGKVYDMAEDANLPDAIKEDPTLKALTVVGKAAVAQRDEAQVYVYEKPGAIVAMRAAKVAQGTGLGPQGFAMQMVANNIEAMSGKDGFAVVRGVTYRLELGLFGMQDQERDFRVISGMIGDEVRISVRAKAEDSDILALLEGVDYDRLNQMLKAPVAGIGSDAPEMTAEESQALATANVAEAAALQRADTIDQQRRLQLAALDMTFRHGKMTQAQYDAAKAKLMSAPSDVGFIAGIAAASEATAAVNDVAASAAAPVGGGIMGMLGGLLGGGSASSDDPEPQKAAPSVSFGGFGGNCSLNGSVKRCSTGNN